MTYLVNGRSNDLDRQRIVGSMYKEGNEKSRQHSDFPGGHPPEYYPSLRLLNFAERTGYGALSLRWPSTNTSVALPNCSLQTSNVKPRTTTNTTHQNEKYEKTRNLTCSVGSVLLHAGAPWQGVLNAVWTEKNGPVVAELFAFA